MVISVTKLVIEPTKSMALRLNRQEAMNKQRDGSFHPVILLQFMGGCTNQPKNYAFV